MIRFFIVLLSVALALYAAATIGVAQGYFHKPSLMLVTLVFLVFSTAVIFVYLYQADKPDFFVQLYLFTMLLKVLAYCVYCFIMISKDKPSAIGNVVFFMIAYFCFTAIEISFLYGKISRSGKS